jgi:hypothetical protein
MQHIKFKKKIKFLETRLQTAIPNGFLARTFFFFSSPLPSFLFFFLIFVQHLEKKRRKTTVPVHGPIYSSLELVFSIISSEGLA